VAKGSKAWRSAGKSSMKSSDWQSESVSGKSGRKAKEDIKAASEKHVAKHRVKAKAW